MGSVYTQSHEVKLAGRKTEPQSGYTVGGDPMGSQQRRLTWLLWLAVAEVVAAFGLIVADGRRAFVPPGWVMVVITAGLLAHSTVTVYRVVRGVEGLSETP
jgi:hypothetical protein